MKFRILGPQALFGVATLLAAPHAAAKPSAIKTFCEIYPESPHCTGKQEMACTFCHTTPPDQNPFGACIKKIMPGNGAFEQDLESALIAAQTMDCDGDGATNLLEFEKGTFPGNRVSFPTDNGQTSGCDASKLGSDWNVCGYDPVHAFRKVHQDFCGFTPEFEAVEAFKDLSTSSQVEKIDQVLDDCLESEFWLGKDGALWSIGHNKIQPLRTIKSGDNGGTIPLGDYDDDYNLFVYYQLEGRDVRGILTANHFVDRLDAPTTYRPIDEVPMHPEAGGIVKLVAPLFNNTQQFVPKLQRAGLLTTLWNATSKTMFTSLPRTNAATAMRSFLNIDIAKGEGLGSLPPATFKLVDHDNKGVTQPACAFCHQVLDPATYPFIKLNGLSFKDQGTGIDIGDVFDPNGTTTIPVPRIARLLADSPTSKILIPGIFKENRAEILAEINIDTEPGVAATPKTGYLLGKPVADIKEWAQVAANSDEFAMATTADYWRLLIGDSATGGEEYKKIWQSLKTDGYSVNAMLKKLIKTEAYGAP